MILIVYKYFFVLFFARKVRKISVQIKIVSHSLFLLYFFTLFLLPCEFCLYSNLCVVYNAWYFSIVSDEITYLYWAIGSSILFVVSIYTETNWAYYVTHIAQYWTYFEIVHQLRSIYFFFSSFCTSNYDVSYRLWISVRV